jgi:hypothetical protein
MTSLYDLFADTCAALASKTKHQARRPQLQQLAEQWRSIKADKENEAVRRPFAPFPGSPAEPATPTSPRPIVYGSHPRGR